MDTLSSENIDFAGVNAFLVNDDTHLRITGIPTGNKLKITMYSLEGRTVFSKKITGSLMNDVEILQLKTSMYILKLVDDEGRTVTKKLIVK